LLTRILSRIFFWTYERGTAPYDIAVAAIVLFVLLTPREWFHDRPVIGPSPQEATIVLFSSDAAAGTQTYHVDPRLLSLPIPPTQLEHLLHDAVRKHVADLKSHTFHIVRIEPVLGKDGTVIYYEVSIKP
jgi:hypothetical protein